MIKTHFFPDTLVPEMQFNCAECFRSFPDMASMTKHISEVHDGGQLVGDNLVEAVLNDGDEEGLDQDPDDEDWEMKSRRGSRRSAAVVPRAERPKRPPPWLTATPAVFVTQNLTQKMKRLSI